MPQSIKFYLHNNYDKGGLNELLDDNEVPCEARANLVDQLYSRFYEVGFEVEYDNAGKITKVSMIEKA
jgi:hypothetical protein